MKRMKKFLCGILMAGIVLAAKSIVPQTVEAAKSDFVIENGILMDYAGNASEVVIPSTVNFIDSMAFYKKTHVTSVVVPNVVTGKRKGTVKIITTVSLGKNKVIHNSLGDMQTYKKTFTTTIKVQ